MRTQAGVATGAVPLIYNPAAGGGRGDERFKEAQALLAERRIAVTPVATQFPRHATELAESLARDGHPTLFVLGGDGTLSEAANGVLLSGKDPTLGFLPAGTGNDFLRDFEVEKRTQAVDRIALGRPRGIDAMRIRYKDPETGEEVERFSINIFGIGFAAKAAEVTNRRYKWAGGQAYNFGVLHKLVAYRPTPTRVVLDGHEERGDLPMVMVCNSIHTGGAMKMAPMARPDDGWLDVLTVEGVGRVELVKLFMQVRDGTHVSNPKVTMRRAKHIELEPDTPSPLLVDGEVYGSTPVRVDVMPGALRVLL
jgi:diacylglycerol kinase (ATP)